MMESEPTIKISVRNLVEFIYRQGDITSTGSGARDVEAMQMGTKIHKKIQKSMGLGYEAEVALFTLQKMKSEEYGEEFWLKIEGRADGIFRDGDKVLIDEIKGVYLDVKELNEPVYVHKAQAMCYAYMVAEQENLSEIQVQVTYCHLETEEIVRFQDVFSRNEIVTWFLELMQQYEDETERAAELDELEEYMGSSEYIEDVAKSKLGLTYENEIIFKEGEGE